VKRFSFPKRKRLLTNRQFKAVLALRISARDRLLIVCVAQNDCGYPRLGISVGKACGNAVVRNRFKRFLREVFRLSQDRIPGDFDYVVMVSPRWSNKSDDSADAARSAGPTFDQVKASFSALTTAAVEKAARSTKKPAEPRE